MDRDLALVISRIRDVVVSHPHTTVVTDMQANYAFPKVLPGAYVLFAEWPVFDNQLRWYIPFTVDSTSIRIDLNNSNQGGHPCRLGRGR